MSNADESRFRFLTTLEDFPSASREHLLQIEDNYELQELLRVADRQDKHECASTIRNILQSFYPEPK